MTACWMYVGNLDDPSFSWEGGDWNGNVPRPISPEFPPPRDSYNRQFHDWVAQSGVKCKQTDFDGWVAVTTRRQLDEFISFCYLSDPSYTEPDRMLRWEGKPYLVDRLVEIRNFVAGLPEDKEYALVAAAL